MTFTAFGYTLTASLFHGSLVETYIQSGVFDLLQGHSHTVPATLVQFSVLTGTHASVIGAALTLAVAATGALASYLVVRVLGR